MGPNRISCESVRLFVSGNNNAKYYEVLLNYCNHFVSRSAMTGVETLPAKQRNAQVQKAPRMRAHTRTPPNPRGRQRRSGEGTRGAGNELVTIECVAKED